MVHTTLLLNSHQNLVLPEAFLATKLYAPRLRTRFVSRPQLVARLDQGIAQNRLTLISAPTGFGKTTLVSEWLNNSRFMIGDLHLENEGIASLQAAWLSLDAGDNDPIRFLSYFIAALQTIQTNLGQVSLRLLDSTHLITVEADISSSVIGQQKAFPFPFETVLTALVNDLATLPDDVVLILDDYHIIEAPVIHRLLAFLLDNAPPPLHLAIISRTDPPLSLAHLRARRQLLELRASDLRFTQAETVIFLNEVMGLDLSAAEINTLETRSEGWIAGLQLAALSLQNCETEKRPDFIASFSGSHRYILDYLITEVLLHQPEPIQNFLLQTSILERLCGPLCDAVTECMMYDLQLAIDDNPQSETVNSQAILEWLEKANLFIVPLDDERRWYRYHHLFTDLLRNRLQQNYSPAEVAALHRQAADWYERNRLVSAAVSHALASADVTRAARLIEQQARTLLSRSEMTTLLSWLNALPTEAVQTQPQLALFQAWALVLTGQLGAVELYLSQVEHHPGEVAAIQATVAYFRRDMPRAINLFHQALELLPTDNLFLRGAVALSLGIAYSWCGHLTEAGQALTQASTISQTTGNLHVALTALWNLAWLALEQGQLSQAADFCRQGLQLADTRVLGEGQSVLPAAGGAHVVLGCLYYERNELEAATHHLEAGINLGEQGADLAILAIGYLGLARVQQAQDNPDKALLLTRQVEQLAQRLNSSYWAAQAVAAQARLWIENGWLDLAEQWAQTHTLSIDDPPEYLREAEQLTLARLIIAAQWRRGEEAAKPSALTVERLHYFLARLLEAAGTGGRTSRVIEILILQALTYQLNGKMQLAITTLLQALSLAQPEGYIRLFLDVGQPMVELLAEVRRQEGGGSRVYVDKLLTAYKRMKDKGERIKRDELQLSALSPQPLIEPLSERELELLRFIAGGMSNQEVAQTLVVTVGTVKWHLNNIYGKLNVRSRTQAVAQVRKLGLL